MGKVHKSLQKQCWLLAIWKQNKNPCALKYKMYQKKRGEGGGPDCLMAVTIIQLHALHACILPQPTLDSTGAVHAAPLIVLIEDLSIFLAM